MEVRRAVTTYTEKELTRSLWNVIGTHHPRTRITWNLYNSYRRLHSEMQLPGESILQSRFGGWSTALTAAYVAHGQADTRESDRYDLTTVHPTAQLIALLLREDAMTPVVLCEQLNLTKSQLELLLQVISQNDWIINRSEGIFGSVKAAPLFPPAPTETADKSDRRKANFDDQLITIYKQHYTHQEISARMGIGEKAVTRRLARLKKLGVEIPLYPRRKSRGRL